MEKLDIKGIIFSDYNEDGDEIEVKASWVVGNKSSVNFHWLNYGDGTVDKQLLMMTKKDGKPFTNKEIETEAETFIEAIKRDCVDEYINSMMDDK